MSGYVWGNIQKKHVKQFMVSIENKHLHMHGCSTSICKHFQEGTSATTLNIIAFYGDIGAIPINSAPPFTVSCKIISTKKTILIFFHHLFQCLFPCFPPTLGPGELRAAQAVLGEQSKVLCLRFGQDFSPECMKMDEARPGSAGPFPRAPWHGAGAESLERR